MTTVKNQYKSTDRQLVSLTVYNVGNESCAPGHEWGPGVRDHYLIHYIISGKGTYETGGKSYSLQAGDCFLIYPQTEVRYQADVEDPWEYAWVGFSGNDAELILRATSFTRQCPCLFAIDYGDAVLRQILHIYDARGNSFEHMVEMTGRLYTTLSIFMHHKEQETGGDSATEYVQKAITYISANYSYPIKIDEIAEYVGVSRSHLFRSFRSVMGLSPKDYLTDFRIKEACYLLHTTTLSITAIANSVGFDNSLYFSKTFHKEKGCTPSEYRALAKA